ncbi:Aste57867_1544 [Aphanomyces stellatus]|uniref:Aste57867_1544 protein n=1 Tax=Aphanomyces stellatus TaxID=120398 RepID=A0A485K5J0_9STRA|nr:hypothetical protein As57867_001543 [Aphanomyces stellatus]VFT78759.1 Aste57867_1544 [Aphanomyces stellatus]
MAKVAIRIPPRLLPAISTPPHTPASTKITSEQSLNVIKNMIRVSISEICYLRNIFPEEVFRERVYADMRIKCLAPDEVSRDPSMVDAFAITQWLEAGIFDAMGKNYLDQAVFCIYALGKNKSPDHLLESYTYKVKNTVDGSTLSTSFTGMQPIDSHPENVKAQAIQMIRNLVSITNTLEPLPKNRFITMKLSFNESCPADWQPQYFHTLSPDLSESFGKPTLKLDVGRMATPFHAVSMKLQAPEDAFMAEKCPDDDIPQSQVNIIPSDSTDGVPNSPDEIAASQAQKAKSCANEGVSQTRPPTSQKPQRATRNPAMAKDALIRFCVRSETVTVERVSNDLGYDAVVVKKCLDELCGDGVFEKKGDVYTVRANEGTYFEEAINLVHGKRRHHISVHTLAKCLSWSMYFAKSILMRMHHEHLIDMDQEVAFDGYKVILDGLIDDSNRRVRHANGSMQSIREEDTEERLQTICHAREAFKSKLRQCPNLSIGQSHEATPRHDQQNNSLIHVSLSPYVVSFWRQCTQPFPTIQGSSSQVKSPPRLHCHFPVGSIPAHLIIMAPSAAAHKEATVEFTNVRFPSLCSADLYHVQVTTTDGGLPVRLAVKSQQSHNQWLCNVWALAKHAPADGGFVLPPATVVAALQRALATSASPPADCRVDLRHPPDRLSFLTLTLSAFGDFVATYTFELAPLGSAPPTLASVASVDNDAIQGELKGLRDEMLILQKDFLNSQTRSLSALLHLTAPKPTPKGHALAWTTQTRTSPAYFHLSPDATTLTVLQTGVYHVQVRPTSARDSIQLQLFLDEKPALEQSVACRYLPKHTTMQLRSLVAGHAPTDARVFLCLLLEG